MSKQRIVVNIATISHVQTYIESNKSIKIGKLWWPFLFSIKLCHIITWKNVVVNHDLQTMAVAAKEQYFHSKSIASMLRNAISRQFFKARTLWQIRSTCAFRVCLRPSESLDIGFFCLVSHLISTRVKTHTVLPCQKHDI